MKQRRKTNEKNIVIQSIILIVEKKFIVEFFIIVISQFSLPHLLLIGLACMKKARNQPSVLRQRNVIDVK